MARTLTREWAKAIAGMRTDAAVARRTNAGPWTPLPGMRKRRCLACWYWFAAPVGARAPFYCPGCLLPAKVRQREAGDEP